MSEKFTMRDSGVRFIALFSDVFLCIHSNVTKIMNVYF